MVKRSRLHALSHVRHAGRWLRNYWQKSWWHKIVSTAVVLAALSGSTMYGIALWYQHSQAGKPLEMGVSFIPDYARYLGVDPQTTMDGLLDIGVRQFRLVSYWSDYEPAPGKYDFSQLDWQFRKAEARHAKITLSVGLRQPRWPECHMPDWAKNTPSSQWQPRLETFMTAVVNRYKDSPSLASYQLENEFFLENFGTCTNFDRSRLVREFNLVSVLDPRHPIIVSRSDNLPAVPLGAPHGGVIGMSMYRRVWDAGLTRRYFTYPLPPWYYSFLAGSEKILTGRDSIIHELQAEAWAPNGQSLQETSLAEQNKSMSPQRLRDTIKFAKDTGMRHIDLWGGEYWYYRKQILHDPSLWEVAKNEFALSAQE